MRMNFVCHGLMWLVEDGDWIDILLPEIASHKNKHGQPDFQLHTIDPRVNWTLQGVGSSKESIRELVSQMDALIVRKASFDVDFTAVRNRYRVPKPDRIRNFRAAEVSSSILGITPIGCTFGIPHVSHDATCFSYFDVDPNRLGFNSDTGVTLTPRPNPIVVNWCLYAQPDTPEPSGHDVSGMNRILKYSGTNVNPDFKLSLGTPSDRPHVVARQVGLSQTHLMTLLELAQPTTLPETDRSGCHKAFVSDE